MTDPACGRCNDQTKRPGQGVIAGCPIHDNPPETTMTITRSTGYTAAAAFIASIVAANYVTTRYGFVGVGLGLTAAAGTYLAGLALGLRDVIQEGLGRLAVLAVILVGAVVSYAVSDPHIATASAVAILISEAADLAVYTPLRKKAWAGAVLLSNTVGAFVDTIVFLSLAGFFAWSAVEGQMVGKVIWATLVPLGLIYAARSARQSATA